MWDGIPYGEVVGLVSVERWYCSRDASCVEEYTMGRLRTGLWRETHEHCRTMVKVSLPLPACMFTTGLWWMRGR